jgi:hypothetical protein
VIRFLSDNLLRLVAPLDTSQNPVVVVSAGTCTARLFDAFKDTQLAAAAVTAATVLSCGEVGQFEVGDAITLQLDDASYHFAGAIVSIDANADAITITTGLASAARRGARVMRQIGPSVSMLAYGTPAISTTDWGFQGTMESNHADVLPGQAVRVEIALASATPAGLGLLETLRESVVVGA